MKKTMGFTLIELLAIIVILAIIATITTPIILSIIENAKRGVAIDSAYNYIDAIHKSYLTELTNNKSKSLPMGTYVIDENGVLVNEDENLIVNVSGNEPEKFSWVELLKGEVIAYSLKFGDYVVTKYQDTEQTAVKTNEIAENTVAREARLELERQENAKELALTIASTKSGTGLYDVENGWTAYVGGNVIGYSIKVTVEGNDYVVTKSDSESDVLVTKNTTEIASSVDSASEVVNSLANTYLESAYNANKNNTETVSLKVSEIGVDIPSEMDNNSWIYYNYDSNSTPKVSATEYSLKFTVGDVNYTNTIVVNYKNSQVALDTTTNTLMAQKSAIPVDSNGFIATSYVKAHPVYFNPITGEECGIYDAIDNPTGYRETNSTPTYNGVTPGDNQTSCLKWYKYSENADGTVNMILDHNTSLGANTIWNSSKSNLNGPSHVYLYQLYMDTSEWHSSLERNDSYTATWTYNNTPQTFTIDYSKHYASSTATNLSDGGVKARLITAQEVAGITKASNATTDAPAGIAWSEHTSSNSFYLDSNTTSQSANSTNKSAYSWLFDNLYGCNNYGCEYNDSTYSGNKGYWTSSPVAENNSSAWRVYRSGSLESGIVNNYGLRPVITVSSSIVS